MVTTIARLADRNAANLLQEPLVDSGVAICLNESAPPR
jgi:hypothetical protein